MIDALQASLSASGMTFDQRQVEEMVGALWEDSGLDYPQDSLDINGLSTLLSSHEGLVEGLMKSMTAMLLPFDLKPQIRDQMAGSPNFYQLLDQWKQKVVANRLLWSSVAFIFGVNACLFIYRLWKYRNFRHWYGGEDVNFLFMLSRANGLCLNFNSALVLALVLRHSLTYLRKLGFGIILPLDHHLWLHKLVGCLIFVQGW